MKYLSLKDILYHNKKIDIFGDCSLIIYFYFHDFFSTLQSILRNKMVPPLCQTGQSDRTDYRVILSCFQTERQDLLENI